MTLNPQEIALNFCKIEDSKTEYLIWGKQASEVGARKKLAHA